MALALVQTKLEIHTKIDPHVCSVTSSNLRSAVTCQILLSFPFVCGMELHMLWSSVCGHLSDASKNEG